MNGIQLEIRKTSLSTHRAIYIAPEWSLYGVETGFEVMSKVRCCSVRPIAILDP